MWNQAISQQRTSQYYSYGVKKKQELAHLSKYKIFILMLSRSTYRIMRQSLGQMLKVTARQENYLVKLWSIMNRSAFDGKKSALHKLKQNLVVSRARDNTLKNFATLLQRITKYKLKKTFASICLFSQRKNQSMVSNIEQMRKLVFCRKIEKVFSCKKKEYLLKLVAYSSYVDRLHKKVKTVGIISKAFLKSIKLTFFNKLVKNYYSNRSQNNLAQQQQYTDTQTLHKQLKEMKTQLQQKNKSISHLEQQLSELKMQQTANNNNNSFSQYSSNAYNNYYVGRNKSTSKSRKGNNTSQNDSALDFSIGSILGNSFSLNKSRSKGLKRKDSMVSADCNCTYKEKYMKMKNTNESLKNQLQIVKEQLDVAKDLNDHFTNEIKQYFGGEKDSIELDRLKKQVKDLQRQREQLRMKVVKYQHHISMLKSEFKLKIQELYRKVKKQR